MFMVESKNPIYTQLLEKPRKLAVFCTCLLEFCSSSMTILTHTVCYVIIFVGPWEQVRDSNCSGLLNKSEKFLKLSAYDRDKKQVIRVYV